MEVIEFPKKSMPVYYVPWRRLRAGALEHVITEIERTAADGIRLSQWPELGDMQRRLEQLQSDEAIQAGAE